MNVKRGILEIMVSMVNVFLILWLAYNCVYSWMVIVFGVMCIGAVGILPFTSYSYNIIIRYKNIEENKAEILSCTTRVILMSQIIYILTKSVLEKIAKVISKLMIIMVGFCVWIVIGRKDNLGIAIDEFCSSLKVSQFIVRIYDGINSIVDKGIELYFCTQNRIMYGIINEMGVYEMITDSYNEETQQIEFVDSTDDYEDRAREEYEENINDAIHNVSKAQVIVGRYCLNYGNSKEGVQWLAKAAKLGESSAYTQLGTCFMEGIGVEKDKNRAIQYYIKAVKSNDATAMYILAEYYIMKATDKQTVDIAIKLLLKAAQLGDSYAQGKMGRLLYEGEIVKKNENEAYKWLKKAVEDNENMNEGYYLSICYLNGCGVEKDERKGFLILKKFVNAGCGKHIEGLRLLGKCYIEGIGVNKIEARGKYYLNRAKKEEKLVTDILEMMDD